MKREDVKTACSDLMIRREQLALLFKNLPLSLIAIIVNAALLAFLVSDIVPKNIAIGWFAANVIISLARYGTYRLYLKEQGRRDEYWYKVFLLGVVASALVWAFSSILFFQPDSVIHQVFIAFVIAGMVAGALSSLSQIFLFYALFNVIVLVPLILQFFMGDHNIHPYMGVMSALFMVITLVSAKRMSTTIEESFRLRCANDNLINELSFEKERVLEALDEAKEANRSKDTFLANMSHEIRTPLNGVIGFTQLLAKTSLDEQQMKYIETIDKSSKTLLGILNDILDFSKIQSGKITIEALCFNPNEEFEGVLRLFDSMAKEKEISYDVMLDSALPSHVEGDPLRIKQVLSNLISNAIKFTPEKGHVAVTVAVLEATQQTVRIKFSVQDTGVGIHTENLDAIFEAFAQEDSSVSRRFGGTGLGLAICRNFLHLMESELEVKSQPSEGSTFSFELELKRCTPQQEEEGSDTSVSSQTKVREGIILVVEDQPVNQMVVEIMLEEELGFACEVVNNGQEAVDRVKEGKKYLLILMDVNMPIMDGVEATKQIRGFEKERGVPSTPIIALTANVFKHDEERYLQAGMDDVLAKPLIIEALKDKLDHYIPSE